VGLFVRCWCKGVGFLLEFFSRVLALYVHTCEPAAVRASFDFIHPFVMELFRFAGHFAFEPWNGKLFSTKVAICTSLAFSTFFGSSWVSNRSNTGAILFSQAPLRAQSSIFPSAAVIVPIL